MNPIVEQAYKAWRATVADNVPLVAKTSRKPGTGRYPRTTAHKEANRRGALKRWAHSTRSKIARHAVKTYWATLTPEQRSERQRLAAEKMWARRRAEERARMKAERTA